MNEPDSHMELMLLKEYYTAIVTRDILVRYPIRQAKKFETATHYFMSAFTGLFSAVSFRFSEDLGKQLENLIFLEIRRRGCQYYYWKGKKECDFLIKEKEKAAQAMQVSCSLEE